MSATFGVLLAESESTRRQDVAVDLVLLERTFYDPPRASAVRRWHEQLQRSFGDAELVPYVWHLVTHASEDGLRREGARSLSGPAHAFGLLQTTREVDQAWDATRSCVEALGARRVVVRTPPGVAPGAVGRQRLRAFVEARKAEGLGVVWEPEGLWDPLEAAAFAAELGVPLLWRAFVAGRPVRATEGDSLLVAPGAWLRIDGSGRRPRLSADQLDAVLDHLEVQPETVLVFTGPRAAANVASVRDALEP